MENIVGLVKNNPQSLTQMFKNYVFEIMSNKHSYKKNNIIMPYHKIVSIILMAIYNAETSKITPEDIEKFIDFKYSAKEVITKILRLIMGCWK